MPTTSQEVLETPIRYSPILHLPFYLVCVWKVTDVHSPIRVSYTAHLCGSSPGSRGRGFGGSGGQDPPQTSFGIPKNIKEGTNGFICVCLGFST